MVQSTSLFCLADLSLRISKPEYKKVSRKIILQKIMVGADRIRLVTRSSIVSACFVTLINNNTNEERPKMEIPHNIQLLKI
jgi:hypothetical protein